MDTVCSVSGYRTDHLPPDGEDVAREIELLASSRNAGRPEVQGMVDVMNHGRLNAENRILPPSSYVERADQVNPSAYARLPGQRG